MPLQPPNLDDRRFDDLVREARDRIPRYTPEWTDHNASDPGITLLELFSWLSEMIVYRLNRVPERNYVEFLRMIGVELKPAAPAWTELTFIPVTPPAASSVIVPAGARVGAQPPPPAPSASDVPALPGPQEDEPVVFETQRPLVVFANELLSVLVFDGTTYADVTADNAPGAPPFQPLGPTPAAGCALLIGFAADAPLPGDELALTVRAYEKEGSVTSYECDWPGACVTPPGTLRWEYNAGGGTWKTLDVLRDETRGFTRSGDVLFRGPKDAQPVVLGGVAAARFWLRARLLSGTYDVVPRVDAVLTNTVRALAVQTVRDESVGGSNGEPDQVFSLRQTPVYAAPAAPPPPPARAPTEAERAAGDERLRRGELGRGFLLEVDEGAGPLPWREVPDFYTSSADDRHYTLNRTTGHVTFGDGERGRVPLAGINNIVARYYRWGGGARGRVPKETATDLQTNVPGIESVTNYYAAEGGSDEETLDDAKLRSSRELKARDRAVTAEDFEVLALQTPGARVRRAHALPLRHPDFPGVDVPGAVTLLVIPDNGDDCPVPSESTLQAVCAYLNPRRLLTVQLFVAPPRYTRVRVEAAVTASATSDAAEVKRRVEAALHAYLHPLTGGPQGEGWPVGYTVYRSEIFRVILGVGGVQTVGRVRLYLDGSEVAGCDDAGIPPEHIACSEAHRAEVSFADAAATAAGGRC